MSKTSVRKIKLGAEKNETGINTVLTIMPPKCYFFQAWHKGKIFFTLSIIQVVARRQYNPLIPISKTKLVMQTLS
ncbi:MAG: hypothetical protein U0V49_01060 [Saprospiraceae bacterium]